MLKDGLNEEGCVVLKNVRVFTCLLFGWLAEECPVLWAAGLRV